MSGTARAFFTCIFVSALTLPNVSAAASVTASLDDPAETAGEVGDLHFNTKARSYWIRTDTSWEEVGPLGPGALDYLNGRVRAEVSEADGVPTVTFDSGRLLLLNDPDAAGDAGDARLVVEGGTTLRGKMDLMGNADITGDAGIAGKMSVEGDADITGNVAVSGNTTITGDASIGNKLAVTGQFVGKDVLASGNSQFNTLKLSGLDKPDGVTLTAPKFSLGADGEIVVEPGETAGQLKDEEIECLLKLDDSKSVVCDTRFPIADGYTKYVSPGVRAASEILIGAAANSGKINLLWDKYGIATGPAPRLVGNIAEYVAAGYQDTDGGELTRRIVADVDSMLTNIGLAATGHRLESTRSRIGLGRQGYFAAGPLAEPPNGRITLGLHTSVEKMDQTAVLGSGHDENNPLKAVSGTVTLGSHSDKASLMILRGGLGEAGSVAIGTESSAGGKESVAIGKLTGATGDATVVLGSGAGAAAGETLEGSLDGSVVIGAASNLPSVYVYPGQKDEAGSVSLGRESRSLGDESLAAGPFTSADAAHSVVLGSGVDASRPLAPEDDGFVAIGAGSDEPSIGIAPGASGAAGSVAIGTGSAAAGMESLALGKLTSALGDEAVVLGSGAGPGPDESLEASMDGSVVIGAASNLPSIFVYPGQKGEAGGVAIGEESGASGQRAIAVGRFVSADASGALVIGSGASASDPLTAAAGRVVLGAGSSTPSIELVPVDGAAAKIEMAGDVEFKGTMTPASPQLTLGTREKPWEAAFVGSDSLHFVEGETEASISLDTATGQIRVASLGVDDLHLSRTGTCPDDAILTLDGDGRIECSENTVGSERQKAEDAARKAESEAGKAERQASAAARSAQKAEAAATEVETAKDTALGEIEVAKDTALTEIGAEHAAITAEIVGATEAIGVSVGLAAGSATAAGLSATAAGTSASAASSHAEEGKTARQGAQEAQRHATEAREAATSAADRASDSAEEAKTSATNALTSATDAETWAGQSSADADTASAAANEITEFAGQAESASRSAEDAARAAALARDEAAEFAGQATADADTASSAARDVEEARRAVAADAEQVHEARGSASLALADALQAAENARDAAASAEGSASRAEALLDEVRAAGGAASGPANADLRWQVHEERSDSEFRTRFREPFAQGAGNAELNIRNNIPRIAGTGATLPEGATAVSLSGVFELCVRVGATASPDSPDATPLYDGCPVAMPAKVVRRGGTVSRLIDTEDLEFLLANQVPFADLWQQALQTFPNPMLRIQSTQHVRILGVFTATE